MSAQFKGKRILVTGATGFVGANLVRKMLSEGADVAVFTRRDSDKWRLASVIDDIEDATTDLRDKESVAAAVGKAKPEIVFHCAVHGGFPGQTDTTGIIETNLLGTVNLLEACIEDGFELFVNTGSSSEYGVKDEPMRENVQLDPMTGYGIAKAAATQYCRAMALRCKVPVVTLRLFSPYGPYEDASRLIPSVVLSFLKGERPRLSSPESVRDLVFIQDVVDAYMRTASSATDLSGLVLNIGSGEQRSVGDSVEVICRTIETDQEPIWGSIINTRLEPTQWQADISLSAKTINWKPKHTFDEGIAETVSWFRENISLYKNVEAPY